MLIMIDSSRRITAYNKEISKVEAEPYLDKGFLWVEELEIEPPYESGKITEMYLNEDDTVRYEFVSVNVEVTPYQPTNAEIAQMISDFYADMKIAGRI